MGDAADCLAAVAMAARLRLDLVARRRGRRRARVAGPRMRRLIEHLVRGRPRATADLDRLADWEREVFMLVVRGLSMLPSRAS